MTNNAITVVQRKDFTPKVVEVLQQLDITLKEECSVGTLLNYGSGIKEWIHSFEVNLTRDALELGSMYLFAEYYNLTLPAEVRPTTYLSLNALYTGHDNLKSKTASVKKLNSTQIRLDWSGICHKGSKVTALSSEERKCLITIRVMFK